MRVRRKRLDDAIYYEPVEQPSFYRSASLHPWVTFLAAAAVGAAAYIVVSALRARRPGDIEVEVDVVDATEGTDMDDLDSPGPDILDEAWRPSDGQENLPGRG
jgi:hypothetical protein